MKREHADFINDTGFRSILNLNADLEQRRWGDYCKPAPQAVVTVPYDGFMRDSLVGSIVFPPLTKIIDCGGVGEDVASTKKVSALEGVEFSRLQDSRYGEDYKSALDTVSLELSSEVKSGGPDLVFITSRITSNAQLAKVADNGRTAAGEELLAIAVITVPAPSKHELTLKSGLMHVAKLSESVDVLIVIPEARLK